MFDGLLMPSHLLVLGLIAVLLFGAKRLPEIELSSGRYESLFPGSKTATSAYQ